MGLDIRLPIGLMFAMLGIVLVLSGLLMDRAVYQRSLGINVNLWWGLVLLIFGSFMYWFGRQAPSIPSTTEDSAEGRAIEEQERETGLENNSASDT